jgi:uncharacterized protein YdeI (YjbR/CyaY-like superfamily)
MTNAKRRTLKTFYAKNRAQWRAWLRKHYKSEKEIWLVYFKQHTGKPRVEYNDAVEEGLCFGWIDSTVRRIDEERYAQRFSRRNPKTPYSQSNLERLARLVEENKVAKDVLANLPPLATSEFEIPNDILAAIKARKTAWKNFQKFSPSYVRIRIAFIEGARKRPLVFSTRLRYFISMTEKNKMFGFGGIQKYF